MQIYIYLLIYQRKNIQRFDYYVENTQFLLEYRYFFCTFAIGSEEKYRASKEAFAIISR